MMRRKTYAPPFPRPPQRRMRDPYLYVLICQTALCLLVLLGALAAREADPALWSGLGTRYKQLLMSAVPLDGMLGRIPEEAMAAVERAAGEVRARFSGVESQPAPPGEAGEAELTGMGGGGTPENCTPAPVLLSAALDAPVSGRVTSGYGWRVHPITENEDFHRGIDIAAARGGAIHAVLPGVVAETGESAVYGNYIRLDHGRGLQTAYSHCETIVALEGETLRAGELVATVGSTGVSTGPHVHFEILVNGRYYDPAWVTNGLVRDGD